MPPQLTGLLGLATFVALAWLISSDRRRFPWRVVGGGITLQLALAYLVLGTGVGRRLFRAIGDGFESVMGSVRAGSGFLFSGSEGEGGIGEGLLGTFAFGVLPTVIFFSSLMGILYHVGVMQRLVWGMAWVMRYTLGTSGTETMAAAANVFVGHTEAPLVVRPYLATMTRSELCAMMTGGFATVTGGLLGAYAGMGIDISHLLTASVISAPAALLIAKVMVPETGSAGRDASAGTDASDGTDGLDELAGTEEMAWRTESRHVNVIAAAVEGATDGLRLALNVGAVLIAFLALITLVDLLLGVVSVGVGFVTADGEPGLTLGWILGYACWPLAWLVGIPSAECTEAGRLIGLKTVANEFIAFSELGRIADDPDAALSERSRTLLTYALAGFSNFGAIGIQVGGIGGLEPSRKSELAELGLRAMFGGLLACCMTAAVAGLLLA